MNRTELLIHPVRLHILQYLSIHGKGTTSEIIASLPTASKASVYNHIRLLEQNQVIQVERENRIRGTLEKVYVLKKAEGNQDFQAIMTFLLSLMSDFGAYYETEGHPAEDMLFAGKDCLFLTDEEYRQFLEDYEKLCRSYFGKTSQGAKMRNISIISSPANRKNEEI